MPARAEETLQESFARALEAMLAADATSDELWQVLRAFVARRKVEAFRRAQDNGVHLLPVHTYSPVPDTRGTGARLLPPVPGEGSPLGLANSCCPAWQP